MAHKRTQAELDEHAPEVRGRVRDSSGNGVDAAVVTVFGGPGPDHDTMGQATTDASGEFILDLRPEDFGCELQVGVTDKKGKTLVAPRWWAWQPDGTTLHIDIEVPKHSFLDPANLRPTLQLGPITADAQAVAKATPELASEIARALVGEKLPSAARRRVGSIFPQVIFDKTVETLCASSVLEGLNALIRFKDWPREVALEVDAILRMESNAFALTTHNCDNFSITFDQTQVAADDSAATVNQPGSNPVSPMPGGQLPAGPPPTYIKRVCFWLEFALATYTSPPFNMRNPAGTGPIPVVINTAPFGKADAATGTIFLNNALSSDLLCAVAVHELFHMVQFQYGGSGPWKQSVFEGGAVFAEDAVADRMNRYLSEAGSNFNGTGVMTNPNLPLVTASYKASLFWRYVAEQRSWDRTEPFVGVETYRRILEECSAGGYRTEDVRKALRSLPWNEAFSEFSYLDSNRRDLMSSETTLANYALACRLRDAGISVPDRRFDFVEDEEDIFIDSVVPGAPQQTTLDSVALAGTPTITPTKTVLLVGNVAALASRYYDVMIDPAVTNIQVNFTAASSLQSQIVQIALIDTNGAVRDIHRSDRSPYSKRVTNLRDGTKLSRLAIVVSGLAVQGVLTPGGETLGDFGLSVGPAPPAPDVMVTRWNTAVRNEYEVDSSFWAWTWVSPDIYIDNDLDGSADILVFNTDNKLHIRLQQGKRRRFRHRR